MMDKAKRYYHKIALRNKQRALNKQYEKEGLTDELLDEQLKVNKKRNELNIRDNTQCIFENFVQ